MATNDPELGLTRVNVEENTAGSMRDRVCYSVRRSVAPIAARLNRFDEKIVGFLAGHLIHNGNKVSIGLAVMCVLCAFLIPPAGKLKEKWSTNWVFFDGFNGCLFGVNVVLVSLAYGARYLKMDFGRIKWMGQLLGDIFNCVTTTTVAYNYGSAERMDIKGQLIIGFSVFCLIMISDVPTELGMFQLFTQMPIQTVLALRRQLRKEKQELGMAWWMLMPFLWLLFTLWMRISISRKYEKEAPVGNGGGPTANTTGSNDDGNGSPTTPSNDDGSPTTPRTDDDAPTLRSPPPPGTTRTFTLPFWQAPNFFHRGSTSVRLCPIPEEHVLEPSYLSYASRLAFYG